MRSTVTFILQMTPQLIDLLVVIEQPTYPFPSAISSEMRIRGGPNMHRLLLWGRKCAEVYKNYQSS